MPRQVNKDLPARLSSRIRQKKMHLIEFFAGRELPPLKFSGTLLEQNY